MKNFTTKWMVLGTLAAGGIFAAGCAHNDAAGTTPASNTGGSGYSNGSTPTSDQQNMNTPTSTPSNAAPVDNMSPPSGTGNTPANSTGTTGTGTAPRGDNTNLNDLHQGAGGSGAAGAAVTPGSNSDVTGKTTDLNSDSRSTGTNLGTAGSSSSIGSDSSSHDTSVSAPSDTTPAPTTKAKRHHKRVHPASDSQMNSQGDSSSITP